MDVEELESVVDAMADEGGDQIDALYDTITLNKDTYNGFICRLREVVRLAKNEQEKSAPVGNAAAMRKALEKVYRIASTAKNDFDVFAGIERIWRISEWVIAAPARNCDAFSKAEVLKVLDDRSFSKEDTIEWLYSTAEEREGGNNGRK